MINYRSPCRRAFLQKLKESLNGQAAEVYDEGIQKLVTRYDKCLNIGGDYVEK
jgi:hypothetical protein